MRLCAVLDSGVACWVSCNSIGIGIIVYVYNIRIERVAGAVGTPIECYLKLILYCRHLYLYRYI